MITVCFRLAHSFKTMDRHEPVAAEAAPLRTIKYLRSGRGGKDGVWFTSFVERREPKIYELWTFPKDGTREVHLFARIQISDDFTGETFHTDFVIAKGRRVALLGRRSVNRSAQWLDVPQPFCKTGVATAA